MDTLFPDESGSFIQHDTNYCKDNMATASEILFSQDTSHILDLAQRTLVVALFYVEHPSVPWSRHSQVLPLVNLMHLASSLIGDALSLNKVH